MPVTRGGIHLGELSPDEQEKVERLAEASPPEDESGHAAVTAFLVIINEDGTVLVTGDVNTPLRLQRFPSSDEIYSGCAVAQKSIAAQETAARTQQVMMQAAQQMQQQAMQAQQEAQIRQQLAKGGPIRR